MHNKNPLILVTEYLVVCYVWWHAQTEKNETLQWVQWVNGNPVTEEWNLGNYCSSAVSICAVLITIEELDLGETRDFVTHKA